MRIWRWDRKKDESGWSLGGVSLGERPWLVLGGGGLKGLAHVGVWRELQERGFSPAGIVGTSIGALVGACIAGGQAIEKLEAEARTVDRGEIARLQRRALWINGIRSPSLFDGEALRGYFARVLPSGGWDALDTRFQANAVELGSGRTEWFGIGARTDVSLVDAVYASAALPVFYPAARLPGGVYIDGGADQALPMGRAAELGATGIVAVDVGSGQEADAERVMKGGMLAVHERVFSMMSGLRRREGVAEWEGVPLLYLRPRLDGISGFDFERTAEFVQLGREAVRELEEQKAEAGASGPITEPPAP